MQTTADKVVATLLLATLLLTAAVCATQVRLVLRSPYLNIEQVQGLASFYAGVLLLSLTNMELLRVLPWRKGYALVDGLPDQRLMLRIWLAVMFLEDLPQLTIQVFVTASVGSNGLLGPLSIAFTITSIVWRAIRKAIFLVPSSSSATTSSSSASTYTRGSTIAWASQVALPSSRRSGAIPVGVAAMAKNSSESSRESSESVARSYV